MPPDDPMPEQWLIAHDFPMAGRLFRAAMLNDKQFGLGQLADLAV
jgi:hypothetical protein